MGSGIAVLSRRTDCDSLTGPAVGQAYRRRRGSSDHTDLNLVVKEHY